MVFPDSLVVLCFIALAGVVTYFIFRGVSGASIIYRAPLFITCAVPLLYMGVASLPFAFEPVFTKLIGHNIRDVYRFPKQQNGTEFSESWWLARWQDPIQNVVLVLVLIGIVWALVNATIDRERKANFVGLVTGVALVVLWLVMSSAFGLFF